MFTSFKNAELFRYFVRVDLEKNINKILKQNKSNYSLIVGSVFSGSFSILATYYGTYTSETMGLHKMVIVTLFYISFFIIGMLLFSLVRHLIEYIFNAKKKEKQPSKQEIKEYIDDFDHIACDNILISQEFIKVYNDNETPAPLKEFYYYEIAYYTKVSLTIIQKLIVNKNLCINDRENTDRIHLFRLKNALFMIEQICDFLEKNKDKLEVDMPLQPSVGKMVSQSRTILNTMKEECENIKREKYPA